MSEVSAAVEWESGKGILDFIKFPTKEELAASNARWIERERPNDLATWFPILQATGVNVPRTTIVKAPDDLWKVIEPKEKCEGFEAFVHQLKQAAAAYGYPVFLRTGHTSGKHFFRSMCRIEDESQFTSHIPNMVDWSGMIDMPIDMWVVREWLELESSFTAFDGLPINRERRYFIQGGRVLCHHPYWPDMSIERPSVEEWQPLLATLNEESAEEIAELKQLSELVSGAFGDTAYSLDWARTKDGKWYAIDMALADVSFHWPDCPRLKL